jgi:hypothetical protein
LVNILQFAVHCLILGLNFFGTLSFQRRLFTFYLSLLLSRFLTHMLGVLSIIVFFGVL